MGTESRGSDSSGPRCGGGSDPPPLSYWVGVRLSQPQLLGALRHSHLLTGPREAWESGPWAQGPPCRTVWGQSWWVPLAARAGGGGLGSAGAHHHQELPLGFPELPGEGSRGQKSYHGSQVYEPDLHREPSKCLRGRGWERGEEMGEGGPSQPRGPGFSSCPLVAKASSPTPHPAPGTAHGVQCNWRGGGEQAC